MTEQQLPGNAAAKPLFFHDPNDLEQQLDFVEYWRTLRKRKWAILAFALVVTLLAGVVAFVSTPIYEAKTTLLIETNKQKVVTIEDVYAGVGASREYFQTQVEIIKSREVALKAISKLKLYDNPDFDPRLPKKGVAAVLQQIGFATESEPRRSKRASMKTSRWRRSTQAVAGPDRVFMARSTWASRVTSAGV